MAIEQDVARHYTHGALGRAVLDALGRAGLDPERLTAADLAPLDEFHLGWLPATAALAESLHLAPGMEVLDVGSGIGGPARHFAEAHGCHVTGIDITAEFVAVATDLTARCGLADRVAFRHANALAMPFPAASFDAATLIHVGMNVADKAALFSEVRRVLRPGARFGVYDIVRLASAEPLPYPMPWAESGTTSFVEAPATYRQLLAAAGFALDSEEDRSPLALRLGRELQEKAAQHGPPALGLHVLMGAATKPRMANVMQALARGLIAPVAFVARAT